MHVNRFRKTIFIQACALNLYTRRHPGSGIAVRVQLQQGSVDTEMGGLRSMRVFCCPFLCQTGLGVRAALFSHAAPTV